MNVQLFGNIDNKTYQAPRINLMQKVQEKGATPLTFKETIKGLNDANVSVSISDEGLKALDEVPEYDYLSYMLLRLYENDTYDMNDPRRFRVELSFSPGCVIVSDFSKN